MPEPNLEMRQRALRSEVLRRIGSEAARNVSWARSCMPTLVDVEPLRAAVTRAGADPAVLLADTSVQTAFEAAEGNWEDVANELAAHGATSVRESAAAFRLHVLPARLSMGTRGRHWAGWRTVLTWATAANQLGAILPMTLENFQALTYDMLCMLCPASTIRSVWDAVQGRHRHARVQSPMEAAGGYGCLQRCLNRFAGHQAAFKLPISKEWIHALLRSTVLDRAKLVPLRNALATVVATIACLRPSEGAKLQVCDLWYDYDARAGLRYAKGTMALNIPKRKNDQERKGHAPRFGQATDPDLDVVHQLKTFLRVAGISVDPRCLKQQRPQARCKFCGPVFGKAKKAGKVWQLTNEEMSAEGFSSMIPTALQTIGVSGAGFSGICARRGGITIAIEAGVPEVVLWMQSGHAQERSARRYIAVSRGRPEMLYKTFEAFGL